MRFRYWLILLIFLLACGGFLYLAVFSGEPERGVTLAELDAGASGNAEARDGFSPSGGAQTDWLNGQELQVIFYAVLGICALALALRVVISVVQSVNERRTWSRERALNADPVRSVQNPEGERSVVVTISARERAESEIPLRASAATSSNTPAAMRLRDQVPRSVRGPVAHMIFLFAGIVGIFGVLAAALVYFRLSSSLSDQALMLARVTAINVSDGATPFLLRSNPTGLRELLRKHGARPDVAYIVVQDRAEKVFAHSLPVLPDEIGSLTLDASRESRLVRLGDSDVYEVSAPILEGRAGAVRVGVWRERIDQEIRVTLMPVMTWLLGLTLGGVLLAMFLAWRINRPIFRLVSAAKAISSGDLDIPTPNVGDSGEFGELSRAIERLRSSVKAAMVRLSR